MENALLLNTGNPRNPEISEGGLAPIKIISKPDWKSLTSEFVDLADPWSKFINSQLSQVYDYPDPVPILNLIQNQQIFPVLTRKSYSLWQGKQKSKKTTALALAVAAILKHAHGIYDTEEDLIRFEGTGNPGRVLFFDCEQGESYAAKTQKLILKLSGLDTSDYLIYCDLREFSPTERIEIIHAAVQNTPDVTLVIVDGVVDLMSDFMDSKEGHLIVTDLLKLCSQFDIHVAGVLHQNKGASKDARAHVGSISSQKCEKEIMIEVDPNLRSRSFVTCKESRGIPFEDFAIEWNVGELPKIVQDSVFHLLENSDPAKSKTTGPADFDEFFYVDMLTQIFETDPQPKYSDLWQAIKAYMAIVGKPIGDNRAKDVVSYLLFQKLLIKPGVGNKYYRFNKPV